MSAEQNRLKAQSAGKENWRLWGPYLSERAWGTVREDYSPYGEAWDYFSHDHSHSRAYRWNEDGLGGISDEQQNLCFALAVWNGRDPILKERAFGLTGSQGNHGEDVKEYYFYLDATPTHSFMRYLYKYPQAEFPYAQLVQENQRRTRHDPPFQLEDTGVLDAGYWDVEVIYAKAGEKDIHIQIKATNRGHQAATIHLLPTLWFRNTWSWDHEAPPCPVMEKVATPKASAWAIQARHADLGTYTLSGKTEAELLFTENESNAAKLWGATNAHPYVKDGFHQRVVHGNKDAVNPAHSGTKAAAWSVHAAGPGETVVVDLVLSGTSPSKPFSSHEQVVSKRQKEADQFYYDLLPEASKDDALIFRQALAGMVWTKQFFHYDVARWLDGDQVPPPESRKHGRNASWRHLKAKDVISMPDAWEYPWFAAWDLAFHCGALAMIDVDFAKQQIELLLTDRYLHPNGQIPAYEWTFNDVNPPVIAWAALKVFRADRVQKGKADLNFLSRVLHKLIMNLTWWVNQKDAQGDGIFEGGFLGLDNISVYDRSAPLPPGYRIEQADATGWMAMFALNLTVIALELCAENEDYEGVALHCYKQFLNIADAVAGNRGHGVSLWDDHDGFFKDLIVGPDGSAQRIDVFSFVGIIPLFACEVVDQRLLKNAPKVAALFNEHAGGLFDGHTICACPAHINERGEHLLSIVDHTMLPRILRRVFNPAEFLSPYGIRSVSKYHEHARDLGDVHGIGRAMIEYVPGESNSGLFGGNSNWRGPIWMPTNYMLIQSLEKFQRYLGSGFTVTIPVLGNRELTLEEVSRYLSQRLVDLFRPDTHGAIPSLAGIRAASSDPNWKDLRLFHEYFHADTGQGVGAMHQTGWTGLVANLVHRGYRQDIPTFWRKQGRGL